MATKKKATTTPVDTTTAAIPQPVPPTEAAKLVGEVHLYHPHGCLAKLQFHYTNAEEAIKEVNEFLKHGFSPTSAAWTPPEGKPTTEQVKAAAEAIAQEVEKPNLDRAKENMEKAVAKEQAKSDATDAEAEKKRVAKLVAEWRHFLFTLNDGPTGPEATEKTRELLKTESQEVIGIIWKKAIGDWRKETGFEWDQKTKAWVAPRDEGDSTDPIPW